MSEENTRIPDELVGRLHSARRVAVLTGAGISAESGIPTFREAQTGLWARYQPEELATPDAYRRNPRLVWEWYQWRRGLVGEASPNPGHYALAQLEECIPEFTLITQNVDGLHQHAGSGVNAALIELHGNIQRTKCSNNGHPIDRWENDISPPRCRICGSNLRPDVVWYGESLPAEALNAAWAAVGNCEIFFSIGTSTVVEPAASLPFIALRSGAIIVEVNPVETPLTASAHYVLRGRSGEVMPKIIHSVWGK